MRILKLTGIAKDEIILNQADFHAAVRDTNNQSTRVFVSTDRSHWYNVLNTLRDIEQQLTR